VRLTRSKENLAGLASRMVAADELAFAEFAEYFGPRFRALFVNRGLSISDAEDLAVSCVTDTALKVDKYRAEENGNFEGWVFTVARHYAADWWRRRKFGTVAIEESVTAMAPLVDPEETKPNENVVDAVRDALRQLPEADVILIKFRNLGPEHTFAELAERIGISQEAARVRHFRALKRLKSLLEVDPRIVSILRKGTEKEECYE
jgi:RNA polymerase sigma-70 factor (ECF subfamily)